MSLLSKKLLLLFTFVVIVCRINSLAQASFSAKISPGSIGKNETAELRLMVDNAKNVEQIIPPSLKDFTVISGPNREEGMESINGVTRQYIGITYLLRPRSAGKFTIAQAFAKADGKTLKSNLVTLEVTKNSTGNSQGSSGSLFSGLSPFPEPVAHSSFNDYIIKKGENIAEKINKNIFIKLDISKPACYVGEPVIVTYKLYTRLKSESSITKNPSFNGFSVIDLLPPGNTYYSVETLNGREYNVYILRKSQLYPLQPGTVELESAEVENNIHFIKEEYIKRQRDEIDDLFREFTQTTIPAEGIHDEKVTLQSKPAVITVKPLPSTDKPASFSGAVGNFSIDAALEKNSLTTDDAGKLSIAISGKGNMSLTIAPDIAWPGGIESYEPKTKERLDKLNIPVSGTKVFDYPFTVSKPGNYNFPPITFSFFDVKEGRYKTVNTRALSLTVSRGTGKRPVTINGNIVRTGKEQFFETMFTNRWLIVVPIGIFIITGLFIWVQKEMKRNSVVPVKVETRDDIPAGDAGTDKILPVKPLLQTEEKLVMQDTRGFYEVLNNELRQFLSEKLDIPLATINKKRIAEEADKRGITVVTSLQIQHLLDEIEWQLYTPYAAEDKMQDMYNNADAIVHALTTASR